MGEYLSVLSENITSTVISVHLTHSENIQTRSNAHIQVFSFVGPGQFLNQKKTEIWFLFRKSTKDIYFVFKSFESVIFFYGTVL